MLDWAKSNTGSIDASRLRRGVILPNHESVRLGPESLLPPALDTEIIKVASAQADLEDSGE